MNTLALTGKKHVCITALGAAYLTFVFLINQFQAEFIRTPLQAIVSFLVVLSFFLLCCFLLHTLAQKVQTLFACSSEKGKLSPQVFLWVALSVFVLYSLYLAAHYPGGFSVDTKWQWEQAHSLDFDDHHPFFHTYLFLLLTSVWDSYTFMLLVQIAAFSCALGYLAATMCAWGFRRSLVFFLCGFIAINSSTRSILLFFWKDTALSIFFLFFLSHIFNIVLTNGEWLKEKHHWVISAILLVCITLVRHNAILLTAPLLVLMVFCLPNLRRTCVKLIVLVLILCIGFKGPVQNFYHVKPASDTYLETTGLPMTILCSAYAYSPDTMPEEAYQFMEQFEEQEVVAAQYEFGNYNSVKWFLDFSQEKIEQISVGDFVKLTWETIKSDPVLALRSVLELTDMVWDPLGSEYHLVDQTISESPSFLPLSPAIQSACSVLFQFVDGVLDEAIFQKLSSQLGVLILVMLLACYLSIHRFRGWSCLWVILPIMCYNFGTMLLLCGPDYRFFHFNCLAAYPLAILLLSKPRKAENATCI